MSGEGDRRKASPLSGPKGNKSLRKSENFLLSIFNDNLCLIFEYNCSAVEATAAQLCPYPYPYSYSYSAPTTHTQTMAMCVNDVECMHKTLGNS